MSGGCFGSRGAPLSNSRPAALLTEQAQHAQRNHASRASRDCLCKRFAVRHRAGSTAPFPCVASLGAAACIVPANAMLSGRQTPFLKRESNAGKSYCRRNDISLACAHAGSLLWQVAISTSNSNAKKFGTRGAVVMAMCIWRENKEGRPSPPPACVRPQAEPSATIHTERSQ